MNRAPIALIALLLALAGCSTHNTTLTRKSVPGQVIYRISEEQAFRIVLAAYAQVLPKQSLYDIVESGLRGYESTWRWGLDTYSQKVFVIPAVGTDTNGREVQGYWFAVSGSGSSGSGRSRNIDLYRRIRETLDATGTAVVVTNLRESRYETDGQAYRAEGRDAVEAARTGR